MPDFVWVQHTTASVGGSTTCTTCSTHACPDGFVDLLVNREVSIGGLSASTGRLYMCANCVREASRKVGMTDEEKVYELAERLAKAAEVETELRTELALEKENKLLTIQAAKQIWRDNMQSTLETTP